MILDEKASLKMISLPVSIFVLLFASYDAFTVPSTPSNINHGKTVLNAISRRDAFLTGAAALFGTVASPKPSLANEEVKPLSREEDDNGVSINGAFVTIGYASLAGSLISDGLLDSSSEFQNFDSSVLDVVETNIASNVDSVSSVRANLSCFNQSLTSKNDYFLFKIWISFIFFIHIT